MHRQTYSIHEENEQASHQLGKVYRYAYWYAFTMVSLVLYVIGLILTIPFFWLTWWVLSWIPWTIVFSILVALSIMVLVRYQLGQMQITLVEAKSEPVSEPPVYAETYHLVREESPVIVDAK